MPNRYHANLFLLVTIGLALATALVCANDNDLDTATFNLKAKVASWKSEKVVTGSHTNKVPTRRIRRSDSTRREIWRPKTGTKESEWPTSVNLSSSRAYRPQINQRRLVVSVVDLEPHGVVSLHDSYESARQCFLVEIIGYRERALSSTAFGILRVICRAFCCDDASPRSEALN